MLKRLLELILNWLSIGCLLLYDLWLLIKPAAHHTCCLGHRLLLLVLNEPGEVLAIEKLDAILRQWVKVLILHGLLILEELLGPAIVQDREQDLK